MEENKERRTRRRKSWWRTGRLTWRKKAENKEKEENMDEEKKG